MYDIIELLQTLIGPAGNELYADKSVALEQHAAKRQLEPEVLTLAGQSFDTPSVVIPLLQAWIVPEQCCRDQ